MKEFKYTITDPEGNSRTTRQESSVKAAKQFAMHHHS